MRLIEADGSGERLLVTGARTPTWSHDGARIAFERAFDIYAIEPPVRLLRPTRAPQTHFPRRDR